MTLLSQQELEALPLVGFIEPFRRHARRIEVRMDVDGVACIGRWDKTTTGERLVAWRCIDRTPNWFMANNVPNRWTRLARVTRKHSLKGED